VVNFHLEFLLSAKRWLFGEEILEPTLLTVRNNGRNAAIVFLHGFSGSVSTSWQEFVDQLLADKRLDSWDIYRLGYPTSLRLDIPDLWSADPSLETIARQFRTTIGLEPLNTYGGLAVAAHSMGGLIVQRAICDDSPLRKKLTHLFLYGVPSDGLGKARFGSRLKRQVRDMEKGGQFISELRAKWASVFESGTGFELRVIAGNRDEFVSGASSLEPFPDSVRRVVNGNHLQIIQTQSATAENYMVFASALAGQEDRQTAVDGAEVALELRDFHDAVSILAPRSSELDENGIVTLALALEETGQRQEALKVLEDHFGVKTNTEIMCVLAGRLKRQWLSSSVAIDRQKSRDLYEKALYISERSNNYAQAYYSAINIAFIDLMSLPASSGVTAEVKEMADRAMAHCLKAASSHWTFATLGEASLMLGKLEAAVGWYRKAFAMGATPREKESMATQAVFVAERVFGKQGMREIYSVFGLNSFETA